jgi:hypothetical protein
MVKYHVNISLLLHHSLLSPCIAMYKTYVVQYIASLFIFIVSNIVNEQYVIRISVDKTILLLLVV